MEESVKKAAREGNVSDLYTLIERDGNVLRSFDEKEFIDTPLHIAATHGCIDFAMEIMILMPSFARKLNQRGLSPMHLAIENGHKELVLLLFDYAKDLVHLKGSKGETPLHYVISRESNQLELLSKFLKDCPECIRDVNNERQTALHLAARNNREEALKLLCQMLRKKDYYADMVNQKDRNGNTALHIAARNNHHEMVKQLLNHKADKHAIDETGSTALDIAQQLNNIQTSNVLRGCLIIGVHNFKIRLQKQIFKKVTRASSVIFHDMDNISWDGRNALLVILGLVLTATFQASLSPPAGVLQCESSSKFTSIGHKKVEKSVMDEFAFLTFYIPTYLVFIVTFFLILSLLKPFPSGFRTTLQVLLAFLAVCFDQSISYLDQTNSESIVLNIISILVFLIMLLMCIANRVSKASAILGYWLLIPAVDKLVETIFEESLILEYSYAGCFLFCFLHDEFWKGSLITVGYGLYNISINVEYLERPEDYYACFYALPSWLFLSLCRFCIKLYNEPRTRIRMQNLQLPIY